MKNNGCSILILSRDISKGRLSEGEFRRGFEEEGVLLELEELEEGA